jgi:hypothetical protein
MTSMVCKINTKYMADCMYSAGFQGNEGRFILPVFKTINTLAAYNSETGTYGKIDTAFILIKLKQHLLYTD